MKGALPWTSCIAGMDRFQQSRRMVSGAPRKSVIVKMAHIIAAKVADFFDNFVATPQQRAAFSETATAQEIGHRFLSAPLL